MEDREFQIAISFGLAAAVTLGMFYINKLLSILETCQRAIYSTVEILTRRPHVDEYQILYGQNPDSKVVRSRSYLRPVLILRDPDLIKSVISKDFEYFRDRPSKGNSSELFDLDGEIWKKAKTRLLPVFSQEPLRGLFKYFTSNLGTLITRISQQESPMDVTEQVKICVSDIVSLAIFGFKITIGHKKDEFSRHALSVIAGGPFRRISSLLFGEQRMPSKTGMYFKGFLGKKFQSPLEITPDCDFVKMISQVNRKTIEGTGMASQSENENSELLPTEEKVDLSDEILQDAVLQFLTSGFEPIVGAITFVLYDLCKEPNDIQMKVRDEVVSCVAKNSGYNYDAIQEMRFLDSCICGVHFVSHCDSNTPQSTLDIESLRLHPPVHAINRLCVKDYVSEDGIFFNEGDSIAIPILGIHTDKRYFPEPEKYRPQRFENDESKNNSMYMPFGYGPRKCIGNHYALLVIKTIVAKLVYQFRFTLSEESKYKSPHVIKGSYIIPNKIMFNVDLAQATSILK